MPLNFETIKTNLYNWAVANSGGASVIFLNENAPRPSPPYLTLFLSSLNQIGEDYTPDPDVNGMVDMVGDRRIYPSNSNLRWRLHHPPRKFKKQPTDADCPRYVESQWNRLRQSLCNQRCHRAARFPIRKASGHGCPL